MAGYRRQNTDGPNSEDKALDLFAEMMIEKLENISKDWKKPWFTRGQPSVATQSVRTRIQWYECAYAHAALRKGRIHYSEILHI